MSDVFILSGQRTAIGDYGKSLKDVPPIKLGEISSVPPWRNPAWRRRKFSRW